MDKADCNRSEDHSNYKCQALKKPQAGEAGHARCDSKAMASPESAELRAPDDELDAGRESSDVRLLQTRRARRRSRKHARVGCNRLVRDGMRAGTAVNTEQRLSTDEQQNAKREQQKGRARARRPEEKKR